MQRQLRFAETKPAAGNFHNMMLAVTGQWVTEVTVVLCLFGAACIGLAFTAGEGGDRPLKQSATKRKPTRPDEQGADF
jgi:hypothetical protein